MAKKEEAAKATSPSPQPVANPKPPGMFTALRWIFFSATVAVAIGMLALTDQHLTGIPWVYDGPLPQYKGRTITIDFCLLSPSRDGSADANCNFTFTAAAISLAISLIWSYIQVLRRNPFKHSKAKIADLALCLLGAAWWVILGVLLCTWADRANKAGLVANNWRNGLCVLAWVQFLLFAALSSTSAFLLTAKTQPLFDEWSAKQQRKKEERKAAKMQKMRDEAAAMEAAEAAAHRPQAPQAAAASRPAGSQQLPVSTPATAAAAHVPDAGAANPFRTGGVAKPSADNV